MTSNFAAQAAFYFAVMYSSLYVVTNVNAQCLGNGINTNISSDLVFIGESVTLSCYVSGMTGVPISWVNPADDLLTVDAAISANLDGAKYVISGNNVNPNCLVYNLTITNLTLADAGSYSCRPMASKSPNSSVDVYFGYAPGPTYPECRMAGGSTLVKSGDVLEFICETEPGAPLWDLGWVSTLYGTVEVPTTTSSTLNSELKRITTTLNATADENGKVVSCIAKCLDPECIDTVERNCSFGRVVVVDNPVDEYFFITNPSLPVTIGGNASIECQTTLPGTKLEWFIHESLTENVVTESTQTGQIATIYITAIKNTTVANPFVCSLSIGGSIIATRKASLTLATATTTQMPTMATTGAAMTTSNTTALPPMNMTATPSMLVNTTQQGSMNATIPSVNTTANTPSLNGTRNGTTTESFNTTAGTTAGPFSNTTAGLGVNTTVIPNVNTTAGPDVNATTGPFVNMTTVLDTNSTVGPVVNTTSQVPLLQTNSTLNSTQQPFATTLPGNGNTTFRSGNATGTDGPYNPTIEQRTMSTDPWWRPGTTLKFPQQTNFPQPTNIQPGAPSTDTPTTPVAAGPSSAIEEFFTLPIIMGIAAVGGLILIFTTAAIVCVLTSKKRRGGSHDVEELTELSKRDSKPIRLDPYEVPSNRTTESDPTFAAFGKGSSTQDLINIGEDSSPQQQNGSNNVAKSNRNNGSADTRPLTANDLLSDGFDNHGLSDSVL